MFAMAPLKGFQDSDSMAGGFSLFGEEAAAQRELRTRWRCCFEGSYTRAIPINKTLMIDALFWGQGCKFGTF